MFGLILLPFIASAPRSPAKFEHKISTMLSFDLRRKTKHHRERNSTAITPTPTTITDSDEEEMEFTLRVCFVKLRAHKFAKLKQVLYRCQNLFDMHGKSFARLISHAVVFNYIKLFFLQSTSYAYVIELDLGTPPQRVMYLFIIIQI